MFDGAALGHTRLALVDAAGGAQPITNEDGSVACVVSGELYDDARLRGMLESRGHRFRCKSDSELVVHLYEEYGDAFVDHLRGEFAVAIWDDRRKRLVCARDRFGVRPLVWARGAWGVAVASEAKALFALGVPRRWDAESLWTSMSAQYTLPDRTVFAGVAQVPPGCLLVVDEGSSRVARYWDIDFPPAAEKRHVAPDELRAALADAVGVRLRGEHGALACALSGGIDSSAVAALATLQRRSDVQCFSLSFTGGGEYDEAAIATRTAAHLGVRLHVVRASAEALWDALPAAVEESEGFAVNLHLPAKWLLARAVKREGISVLLTGEGADEALGGYAHFRRDLLLERGACDADLAAHNEASAGLMMPEGAMLDTSALGRAFGFVPSFVEAKAALGFRATSLLSKDFVQPFIERDPYAEIASALDIDGQLRGRERIDQSAYVWCKLALAGYILRTLGDGTEMAHAVEGRVPFLDHHFFELARVAKTTDKIRGIEKHVLREAMKGDLPEEVLARRKHPLLAPPVLASGAAAEKARELLRSSSLPPMFDAHAVSATLDRLAIAGGHEQKLWDPALMLVLSATLLARHYGLET
jgi:asparagine synthase (glutamine-hydrolysing)